MKRKEELESLMHTIICEYCHETNIKEQLTFLSEMTCHMLEHVIGDKLSFKLLLDYERDNNYRTLMEVIAKKQESPETIVNDLISKLTKH